MATTDQLVALAQAALASEPRQVVSVCRQIIAHEKPQSRLRTGLERLLLSRSGAPVGPPSRDGLRPSRAPQPRTPGWGIPAEYKNLVEQTAPVLPFADVLLPPGVSQGVDRFLAERHHTDDLRAAGLAPAHRILLTGPPGNGKTTLAGAIADALRMPFLVMSYSRVISSYMGATGGGIAKVFRGLAAPQGLHPGEGLPPGNGLAAPQGLVLLMDEMETLLTERDRQNNDVGEIARVTSTLLLEIDRLPDHVILIGATNHAGMLDRAVIRRFEHRWELPAPTDALVDRWFDRFARRYPTVPLLEHKAEVLQDTGGRSLSDIERTTLAWCRAWVVKDARIRALHGKTEKLK